MYGKSFASMYEGSMFGLPSVVFAVWGYVLAKQRPNKERVYTVELNPAVLAATFSETPESILSAIRTLCEPDKRSRSPAEEGRRLVPAADDLDGPMLYRVVNGAAYAALRDEDDRRVYLREAKRRQRAKSTASTNVNTVNHGQPPSTQLESESESKSDAEVGAQPEVARKRPQPSATVRDVREDAQTSTHSREQIAEAGGDRLKLASASPVGDIDPDEDPMEPPLEAPVVPLWRLAGAVWEKVCCRGMSAPVDRHSRALTAAMDGLELLAPGSSRSELLGGFEIACKSYLANCHAKGKRPSLRFFLEDFASSWAPKVRNG